MRESDTHTQHSQKQSNLSSFIPIPIHVAPQTVRKAKKNHSDFCRINIMYTVLAQLEGSSVQDELKNIIVCELYNGS